MNKIRQKFSSFLKQFKNEQIPDRAIDTALLSSFEILPGLLRGSVVQRVVLAIPGRGCSLFHRPQGGCLHCGLFSDGIISPETDQEQVISAFAGDLNRHDFSRSPVLCIYVPGSFLDDQEIDPETRRAIFSLVAQQTKIKKIIFESLPQFITEHRINELKSVLADKEIEIAVGLDSSDDQIRDLCINKNFTLRTFEQSCALLQRQEIRFSAFALLKPPFLTEQESIADTVRTAQYAFDKGAAAVSIEPNTVQENTFVWKLFRQNMYRPPWLWSIIEVIKQVPPGQELRIGGMVVYPRAIQIAHNCDQCSTRIWQKIQEYNLNQDKNIFTNLECNCKNQWYEKLHLDSPPLPDRIENALYELSR
jgi:radical SAM enzyme (TIGR01210 family)